MYTTSKKIYFPDSQGHTLCGILESVGSESCVIIVSGYPIVNDLGKDKLYKILLAQEFNNQGIDSFRYDHFGVGESEGKRENLTVSLGIDGIISAFDYCKKLGYKKIGLFGGSFGGLCTLFASLQREVSGIFVIAPVGDYYQVRLSQLGEEKMKEREETGLMNFEGRSIPYNYVEDAKKYIIVNHADKIKVPVLIVHGDQDDNVPLSQSQVLVKKLPNGKLIVFEGEGHGIKDPKNKEKLKMMIVDFMKKRLLE